MDWYSIVKFLHVTSAILWLGGGFVLVLLAVRAERSGDPQALMLNIRNTAALGMILFMPASLATLLWHQRLHAMGVEVPWRRYLLLGTVAAPLTVLAAVVPLAL